MNDPWVCLECGARQDASGVCRGCGRDDVLDARNVNVRDLMHDTERGLADRREGRLRLVGVVTAMAIVFAGWLIPGYWTLRGTLYPGLPLLFDQWIFMALIGLGVLKLGGRMWNKPRFPYLEELEQAAREPQASDARPYLEELEQAREPQASDARQTA